MSKDEQQVSIQGRLTSIDALRGFDMFWIIGGGAIFSTLDGYSLRYKRKKCHPNGIDSC
ncbi:MAG: hypothetical protein ACYSXD_06045 [Planctomycetota bacterium]